MADLVNGSLEDRLDAASELAQVRTLYGPPANAVEPDRLR